MNIAGKTLPDATRPTARNLFYATERVFKAGIKSPILVVKEADSEL